MNALSLALAFASGLLALCLAYVAALVLLRPERLFPDAPGLSPFTGGWRRLAVLGAGAAWLLILALGTYELLHWIPARWEIPVSIGGEDGTTWAPLRFSLSLLIAGALGIRSIDALQVDTERRAEAAHARRQRA